MKTTKKEYETKFEKLQDLMYAKRNDTGVTDQEEQEIEEIKAYLDQLPKAKIEYHVGSTKFYAEVVKIGKTYYKGGRSLTKSRGYINIKEIAEITQEMEEQMRDDFQSS